MMKSHRMRILWDYVRDIHIPLLKKKKKKKRKKKKDIHIPRFMVERKPYLLLVDLRDVKDIQISDFSVERKP
jgi:hypothetical protein